MSWNQHLFRQSRIRLKTSIRTSLNRAMPLIFQHPAQSTLLWIKLKPTQAIAYELLQNKMTSAYIWPLLTAPASETEHCVCSIVVQWRALKMSRFEPNLLSRSVSSDRVIQGKVRLLELTISDRHQSVKCFKVGMQSEGSGHNISVTDVTVCYSEHVVPSCQLKMAIIKS